MLMISIHQIQNECLNVRFIFDGMTINFVHLDIDRVHRIAYWVHTVAVNWFGSVESMVEKSGAERNLESSPASPGNALLRNAKLDGGSSHLRFVRRVG